MLTQDLLRDNWPAMSATLSAFRLRNSSMKRACSRMVSERSLDTRSRVTIAAASSGPSEAKGAIRMRSFDAHRDRKSTRLNSSHGYISYAVFCLKKKKRHHTSTAPGTGNTGKLGELTGVYVR